MSLLCHCILKTPGTYTADENVIAIEFMLLKIELVWPRKDIKLFNLSSKLADVFYTGPLVQFLLSLVKNVELLG